MAAANVAITMFAAEGLAGTGYMAIVPAILRLPTQTGAWHASSRSSWGIPDLRIQARPGCAPNCRSIFVNLLASAVHLALVCICLLSSPHYFLGETKHVVQGILVAGGMFTPRSRLDKPQEKLEGWMKGILWPSTIGRVPENVRILVSR